uniref:FLYWCH-type domain-containing protein n=1 Tax=Plectus sambesii TaxID=2011161 RepID=A0A914VVE7_9BILA
MCDVEFIENYTNKGKTAAILDGFAYIKDLTEDKERFKCIHYRTCKSYIRARGGKALILPNGQLIRREHSHDIEPEKIEAWKRRQAFKIQVEEKPHANITALIASARDCETVVANAMPCIDQMERKEFRPAPRSENLEDIEMTLERSRIAIRVPAGDLEVNFLRHDSGGNDPNRLLIFGTTNSVASLSHS